MAMNSIDARKNRKTMPHCTVVHWIQTPPQSGQAQNDANSAETKIRTSEALGAEAAERGRHTIDATAVQELGRIGRGVGAAVGATAAAGAETGRTGECFKGAVTLFSEVETRLCDYKLARAAK